jgi:Phage major capsid protein E
MGVSANEILAPQTILQLVSQLSLPGTTLQRLFGWGFGGENVTRQSGRNFAYDVFDNTRRVATARVPGQAASRQAPQKIGSIAGVFPRAAESISLLDEDLLNRRYLGGSADELDAGGEAYITRQEAYLAQRFANLIEFQTAAMLRGTYAYSNDGDDLRHSFEDSPIQVNFRIPDGNKGGLDMLGNGDILDAVWSDANTDIPEHLQQINSAMVQLTGMGLSHVVLTSQGWRNVINNTKVQQMGGSGNVVFETMKRIKSGEFRAVLRAFPWITFHVVDYGLDIWNGTSETFTKLIEDHCAAFFPEPTPRWVQYLEGSEIVTNGPNGYRAEHYGFYPYSYPKHDPSGWELCAVMNGIPALYTPSAVAYGNIDTLPV